MNGGAVGGVKVAAAVDHDAPDGALDEEQLCGCDDAGGERTLRLPPGGRRRPPTPPPPPPTPRTPADGLLATLEQQEEALPPDGPANEDAAAAEADADPPKNAGRPSKKGRT